jgi:hypothetical protein
MINEYNNPTLLSCMFHNLFPFGIGIHEILYINSLGLSVCDKAWERGFVFLRAQHCI